MCSSAHPFPPPPVLQMWVFEEKVGDRKLTDIINTEHENVKYLPGAKFTPNLRAGVSWLQVLFATAAAAGTTCAKASMFS